MIFKSLRQSPPKHTQNNKAVDYTRSEFFRRFHRQNRQNTDEINCAGDNLTVESDNQANQGKKTEVLLFQNKRGKQTLT